MQCNALTIRGRQSATTADKTLKPKLFRNYFRENKPFTVNL